VGQNWLLAGWAEAADSAITKLCALAAGTGLLAKPAVIPLTPLQWAALVALFAVMPPHKVIAPVRWAAAGLLAIPAGTFLPRAAGTPPAPAAALSRLSLAALVAPISAAWGNTACVWGNIGCVGRYLQTLVSGSDLCDCPALDFDCKLCDWYTLGCGGSQAPRMPKSGPRLRTPRLSISGRWLQALGYWQSRQ
jgi:hypothetical protein